MLFSNFNLKKGKINGSRGQCTEERKFKRLIQLFCYIQPYYGIEVVFYSDIHNGGIMNNTGNIVMAKSELI